MKSSTYQCFWVMDIGFWEAVLNSTNMFGKLPILCFYLFFLYLFQNSALVFFFHFSIWWCNFSNLYFFIFRCYFTLRLFPVNSILLDFFNCSTNPVFFFLFLKTVYLTYVHLLHLLIFLAWFLPSYFICSLYHDLPLFLLFYLLAYCCAVTLFFVPLNFLLAYLKLYYFNCMQRQSVSKPSSWTQRKSHFLLSLSFPFWQLGLQILGCIISVITIIWLLPP